MRPVNLLPPKHRPRKPTGSKSGSAYVVLGILAVALLALVSYVMESNKITTAKSDIAVAEQKTAEARARSQQLGPFANFAQIKQQRVASVKGIAEGRFDWERTVRELAHVLPEGVWLRDFDAALAGAASAASPETAWSGPSIKLHGCAQKQPQVATLMVRLREMQGVHDVKLTESARGDDPEKKTSAGADSPNADGADVEGCGTNRERANYEFNAVVEFEQTKPAPAPNAGETPVRLGGGS